MPEFSVGATPVARPSCNKHQRVYTGKPIERASQRRRPYGDRAGLDHMVDASS